MLAPEMEVELMKIMLWWKIEVGSCAWFYGVLGRFIQGHFVYGLKIPPQK